MANQQLRSIDLAVDSRDIDIAERKLRSLDRMLLQTRRRALALGSTRMRPSITLEDRFTETAIRLSATMKRLNQAAARPVAELIDLATPKIAEIRGALQELSGTRWRVEVDVAGFGAAFGSSVAEQICAEGQSLLQRISVTFQEALECIFNALEVGECPAEAAGECKCGESSGCSPQESEPLCEGAGKTLGQVFFEAFLGLIDPQRIVEKFSNIPWDTMISDAGNALKEFGKKLIESIKSDIVDGAQKELKDQWSNKWLPKIKDSWQNSKVKQAWDNSKVKNEWIPKAKDLWNNSKIKGFMDKPWVKKVTEFIGKGKKIIKIPGISQIQSAHEIFTAKTDRERAGKIGGFVGGLIGTAVTGFFTKNYIATVVGNTVSDMIGEKIGVGIYDLFSEKGKRTFHDPPYPPGTTIADAYLSGGGRKSHPTTDIEQLKHEIIFGTGSKPSGTPLTDEEILSAAEYFKSLNGPLPAPTAPVPVPQAAAPQQAPEIIVNMPPGMVQIHQQQQEIDIDSISKQVGWHVTHNISRVLINMTK
ncbi:hypothetical protein [Paenibacillus ihumii]|uniref:hypothetical protein n=1 Tax=Paenibacillus ihumii TaxID=687436 RepID=UPI0006D76ED5|nr:hypothetical protein [Paenibacillus ihumii]